MNKTNYLCWSFNGDVGWCCRACGLAASQNPFGNCWFKHFLVNCMRYSLQYCNNNIYLEYYGHFNDATNVQFDGGCCDTFLHTFYNGWNVLTYRPSCVCLQI